MSTVKPLLVSATSLANITPKGKVALMPSRPNANLATVANTVVSRQVMSHLEKPKRKRQRLDHLTQEEKVMRRKLKNRMAAQSARDRKKVKMMDLEGEVERLKKENSQLFRRNAKLIVKLQSVERENNELRVRLGMEPVSEEQKYEIELSSSGDEDDSNCSIDSEMQFKTEPNDECSTIELMEMSDSCAEAARSPMASEASLGDAFESAALISVPQQQEQASVSSWEPSLSSAEPASIRHNSNLTKSKKQVMEKCSTSKTSSCSTRKSATPTAPSETLSTTQSYWTTLLMVLLTSLMSSGNSSVEMTGNSSKHNPMIVSMLRALAEQEPALAPLVSKALGSTAETPPSSPERTVEVRPEVIEQLLSQKRVRLRI